MAASLAALAFGAQAQAAGADAALVEQGRRLAVAADCAACHTAPDGGKPFAGGYAIESPLGAIVSSNITPSRADGIGEYTLADFGRALRQGVRKDGARLYPAMPYTAYTRLSDADVAALYAYFLHGVAPVERPAPKTALPFPFSLRVSMAAWNALFLDDRRFAPDAGKSAQWNRGAYLVDALAHCSTCHTPRNALMAERADRTLAGGSVGPWFAPNITSDPVAGIGAWSEADLKDYLKTGHVHGKAQAAGPMAEAIQNSLQHLPDEDLAAIAAYLKQSPAQAGSEKLARFSFGAPSTSEIDLRGDRNADAGWRVFSGSCAECHQPNGTGTGNGAYPSLFHNTASGADRPDNVVSAILFGVHRTVGGEPVFMPAFGDGASYASKLTDQEIADASNYVFAHYGNPAVHVDADAVRELRNGGARPLLARLQPLALPGLVALAVLAIAGLGWRLRRSRHTPGRF
jgi:mono/diheme cytochrome c family protein